MKHNTTERDFYLTLRVEQAENIQRYLYRIEIT